MDTRTKGLLVGAFIVVAVLAFYTGAEFVYWGGSINALLGSKDVQYNTISGQVVARSPTSLTISLGTGSNKVIPLSPSTRVVRIVPALTVPPSFLTIGANVAVVIRGDIVQMIQIISPTMPPVATSTPPKTGPK